MNLLELKKVLNAQILVDRDAFSGDIVWVLAGDLMSDMLKYTDSPDLLLTGLSNIQVIRTASILDIKIIAIVRGKEVDKKLIDSAYEEGHVILNSPISLYEACGRLYKRGLKSIRDKDTL